MITIPRSSPDFVHPKLKVIGLGGAGCNALDRIVLDGLPGAEIVAINTDLQALTGSVAPVRVQIGQTVTRGLGTGGDPEIGRSAAEECSGELQKVVADATIIFVVVGLGGGTGSGALPVLTDLACEQNAFVIVLGTLPFAFEGKRRAEQAAEALYAVRGLADLVICFENDRMGDLVAPNASVQDAFATADQTLAQCVRAMAALVHRRGLLKVGFDEIGSALRGNARSYFGYGEAAGDNRSHEALAAAFKSPLLDHGRALKQAESVVVQMVGGADFTLNEMSIAMEEINRHLSEKTRLYMGMATDSQMTGKLAISIFCGAQVEEPETTTERELAPARRGRVATPAAVAQIEEEPEPVRVSASVAEVVDEDEEEEEEFVEEDATEEDEVEEGDEVEEDADVEGGDDDEEDGGPGMTPALAEEERFAAPVAAARPPLSPRTIFAPMGGAARRAEPAPVRPASAAAEKVRQEQMHFEPVNRGRFEKSEPTIIDGQDLDVPTFMRRNR